MRWGAPSCRTALRCSRASAGPSLALRSRLSSTRLCGIGESAPASDNRAETFRSRASRGQRGFHLHARKGRTAQNVPRRPVTDDIQPAITTSLIPLTTPLPESNLPKSSKVGRFDLSIEENSFRAVRGVAARLWFVALITASVFLVAACSGAAGPQGPQGPQGPEGPQGPDGPQGPAGSTDMMMPHGDQSRSRCPSPTCRVGRSCPRSSLQGMARMPGLCTLSARRQAIPWL